MIISGFYFFDEATIHSDGSAIIFQQLFQRKADPILLKQAEPEFFSPEVGISVPVVPHV
jgi:hypothetical protein